MKQTDTRPLAVLGGLLLLLSAGCGDSSSTTTVGDDTDGGGSSSSASASASATDGLGCAPGQSVQCTCQNGDVGAQTCNPDGKSFSACECTGTTDGGSASGNPTTTNVTTDPTATSGDPTAGTSTGDIPTEKFSFFVTSLAALQELSGSQEGFGGDLRFGEVGPGAGLRGADKICATIAEKSMPGAGNKPWRAFLSATDDGNGNVVNAIDRIGEGPWYDRLGRVFALTKADAMTERPTGIDPAIKDDFPNEDGVPNHQPDPNQPQVDNHDMLTGTNAKGQLYSQTATCADWTGNTGNEGKPRVGHSWPRYGPKPPGGDGSMAHWMSSLDESGCAPGINLIEMGPPIPGEVTVGSGGGYGGFYCFALTP